MLHLQVRLSPSKTTRGTRPVSANPWLKRVECSLRSIWQAQLPLARVVYASATSATELHNLQVSPAHPRHSPSPFFADRHLRHRTQTCSTCDASLPRVSGFPHDVICAMWQYLCRLGLWGRGTPFASFGAFKVRVLSLPSLGGMCPALPPLHVSCSHPPRALGTPPSPSEPPLATCGRKR